MNNWIDISIKEFDAWMMDLQSELDGYTSCDDEEGCYQVECEMRALASRYAEQLKGELQC